MPGIVMLDKREHWLLDLVKPTGWTCVDQSGMRLVGKWYGVRLEAMPDRGRRPDVIVRKSFTTTRPTAAESVENGVPVLELQASPDSSAKTTEAVWVSHLEKFLQRHDPERSGAVALQEPLSGAGAVDDQADRMEGPAGARHSRAGKERPTSAGAVFISYSREDEQYVNELVDHLEKFELACWIDKSGIDYGMRWGKEIRANLDACSAFVVVMTPASEESEWVEREVLRARKLNKPVLPLLLEGEEFFGLSNIQHVSVVGGKMPSLEWVERVKRLVSQAGS